MAKETKEYAVSWEERYTIFRTEYVVADSKAAAKRHIEDGIPGRSRIPGKRTTTRGNGPPHRYCMRVEEAKK